MVLHTMCMFLMWALVAMFNVMFPHRQPVTPLTAFCTRLVYGLLMVHILRNGSLDLTDWDQLDEEQRRFGRKQQNQHLSTGTGGDVGSDSATSDSEGEEDSDQGHSVEHQSSLLYVDISRNPSRRSGGGVLRQSLRPGTDAGDTREESSSMLMRWLAQTRTLILRYWRVAWGSHGLKID